MFHVLNRGVGRMQLFSKEKDYAAFEGLLEQTRQSRPMRICAYCLMPNHWHFVLWPERDGDLAAFMQQLTTKHVRRWQLHRRRVGYGHVYQSRYKSFPVEEEEYFYQVVRYVEAQRAAGGVGERAEAWRWSSLWRRTVGHAGATAIAQRLAGGLSQGLVQVRQRTANGGGGGCDSSLCGPRPAIRRRGLGPSDGETTRTGIDAPSTAPAKKGSRESMIPQIARLSPFFLCPPSSSPVPLLPSK